MMTKRKTLISYIGILKGEEKLVASVGAFRFLNGACQGLLNTAPISLVLSHFDGSVMAYLYILANFLIFITSFAYGYAEQNARFTKLTTGTMLSCISGVVIAGSLLFFNKGDWVYFLVFMLASASYSYIDMTGVCVTNRLYNIDQGKRLLGISSSCQFLGAICSSVLFIFVSKHISIHYAFVLIFALMISSLLIKFFIQKSFPSKVNRDENEQHDTPASTQAKSETMQSGFSLFKQSYVRYIFFFVFLYVICYYSADILMCTAVEKKMSGNIEAISAFFGAFEAANNILNMFVSFVLFNRIMHRFGVIVALSIMPIVTGVLVFLAVITNFIPSAVGILFVFIVLARLFDDVFHSAVTLDSVNILFHPFPPRPRSSLSGKYESLVVPISAMFIGISLIFIEKFVGINVFFIGSIIILACLIEIYLLFFKIRKLYLNKLLSSLSKAYFVNFKLKVDDKISFEFVKKFITKNNNVKKTFSILKILSDTNLKRLIPFLLRQPAEELKSYAIDCIIKNKDKRFTKILRETLSKTDSIILKIKIAEGLLCLGSKEGLPILYDIISKENNYSSVKAAILYFNLGNFSQKNLVYEIIKERINSSDTNLVVEALKIIAGIDFEEKVDYILTHLKNSDTAIRIEACIAAQSILNRRLLDPLLRCLHHTETYSHAFAALCFQGEELVEYLGQEFENYSKETKIEIIEVLSKINKPITLEFLVKKILEKDVTIFDCILDGLFALKYQVNEDESIKKILGEIIHRELNQYEFVLKYFKELAMFQETKKFNSFLLNELKRYSERVFKILGFLHSNESLIKIQQGLKSTDEDKVSYAREALIRILNRDQNLKLTEMLFYSFHELELHEAEDVKRSLPEILDDFMRNKDCFCHLKTPTQMVFLYILGVHHFSSLKEFLTPFVDSQEKSLKETACWSLQQFT